MISRDLEEYRAFLKSIAEGEPADVRLARFAFADWLEEKGLDDEAAEQRRLATEVEVAKARLREIAAACGVRYEALMDAAHRYAKHGDYTHMGENEDYKNGLWGHEQEFWRLYEVVVGEQVKDHETSFFSCSC